MNIMAIDLGKNKSVACMYEAFSGEHAFTTLPTRQQELHDLMVQHHPDRVVIEVGPSVGWVGDLVRALDIELEVANPNHEAWRWRNVKRKTDRDDALKLAKLSAMSQLPTVYLPEAPVRQLRSLIKHRHALVGRRTRIKNSIRAILDREGLGMPAGQSGWTKRTVTWLDSLACPLNEASGDALWRAQLFEELDGLGQADAHVMNVERKLDALSDEDTRVALLRTIPGVGPRLAEALVAIIDDPHRFKTGKQVGAYVGLTPRQYQSGSMDRQGRISGQGDAMLRALLVEVSWLGRHHNGWMKEIYDRAYRGDSSRKKIAIVALARHLLVRCWAMLRDGTAWEPDRNKPAAAA